MKAFKFCCSLKFLGDLFQLFKILNFKWLVISSLLGFRLQLRAKQTAPLVNENYQNEVTLTGQNPLLKFCYPLELSTQFLKGLELLILKIWGL